MKALTIIQPWATLIAIGAKKIETRSWPTSYRGPLAIHAGKDKRFINMHGKDYICAQEPFYSVIMRYAKENPASVLRAPFTFIPLGAIVAVCTLAECCEITHSLPNIIGQERAFGDYTLGRFMWMLEDVKPIKPVFVKGSQGLWDWEGDYAIRS